MPNPDISSPQSYPADFFPGGSLAYLIGMNGYRFVRPLDSPKNDCFGLEQVLRDKHGFTVTTLFDAERQDVLGLLEKVKQECKTNSRIIFYYAGHGIADGADDEHERPKGFLLAVDSQRGKEETYIEMGHVLEVLVGLPSSHLLIILDCCYAGAIRYAEQTRSIGSSVPKTLYAEKFSYYIGNSAKQVITSAACDQKAMDALGSRGALNANQRSPFAESLIRNLQQGDRDWNSRNIQPDGIITASEMGYFLGMEVSDRLSKNNVPFAEQQTPSVFRIGERTKGEFIFVSSQKAILQLKPNPEENPWKGLADYSINDNHLFYGRQRVLDGWWEGKTQYKGLLPLVSAEGNIHKILVTGRSGSGKSSLVKAGVLAKLEEECPGSVTIITPGNTPYSTHNNMLEQLKGKEGKIYLMVDQYEELVTLCNDPIQQKDFENSLAGLSGLPDAKVIITLRSDLERRFVDSPFLDSKLAGDVYRFVIPPFSREEIREVVIQPAIQQLLEFRGTYAAGNTDGDGAKSQDQADERFVNRIIDETFANPDSLPLLSFALSRLFEMKSPSPGNLLLETDYDGFGGISGILDKKLTDAYKAYAMDKQALFRQLIYRMISFDAGYLTKRRVYTTYISGGKILNELEFTDVATMAAMNGIQQELVKQRLLKTSRENEAAGTKDDNVYFEPAHEALLRSSNLISQWQNEAGGAFQGRIILLNTLSASAKNYYFYEGKGKKGSLWKDDPRLGLVKQMWDARTLYLDKVEETFIVESLRARSRAKRILWTVVVTIITLLSVASVVTFLQKQRADNNAAKATEQANIAQGNYLISEAKSAADKDPTLAIRLAEEALKKNNSEVIFSAASTIYRDNTFYKIIVKKNSEVKSVFFSPGDSAIVTIFVDGEVCVRDQRGKTIRDFKLQNPDLTSIAFSGSGNTFLSGYADGSIILYDLSGNIIARFKLNNAAITSATFSRDENTIITGYKDGKVFLSDSKGGAIKELKRHKSSYVFTAYSSVVSTAYSKDGSTILSADEDGGIFLCNMNGVPIKEFKFLLIEVFYAAFSQTYAHYSQTSDFIIVSSPYEISILDRNGKHFGDFISNNKDGLPIIHSVAYSPDGNDLLFGYTDGEAQMRDIVASDTEAKSIRFKGHTNNVSSVAFSHDGALIITGSKDGTTRLWDRSAGEAAGKLKKSFTLGSGEQTGHFNIYSVAFSPDSNSVLTGSEDDTARILDLQTGNIKMYNGHTNSIMSVAYSKTGDSLLTGSADSSAILWNLRGDILQQFKHKGVVTSVAFSPDDKTILTGSLDSTACIWDVKGNKIREIREQNGPVRCVAFSPRGKSILTSTIVSQYYKELPINKHLHNLSLAHLWDINGKLLQTFTPPVQIDISLNEIYSLSFSPDGNKILTGLASGKSILWGIDGQKEQEFGNEDKNGVLSVAFSPNGKILLTSKDDGPVFTWDLAGHLIQTCVIEGIMTPSATFSPDGNRIVTVSSNGEALVFEAKKTLSAFLKTANIEQLSADQKNKYGIK